LKLLKRIIKFGYTSPEKKNRLQAIIRDTEWDAIRENIPLGSSFLDIGCGTGYLMQRAQLDRGCDVTGVDPVPLLAGVKTTVKQDSNFRIFQGTGENLPFENQSFDVVYTSHTLEHVNNIERVLSEIRRVLKLQGIIIIGVPTSSMAWWNGIANVFFTSHIRFARFFANQLFRHKVRYTSFKHIFLPYSHSKINRTILYDIRNYKVSKWRKKIQVELKILKEIRPILFCMPDYWQFFKAKKRKKYSSSVFFICSL
jgi:ubiquinone/menaquinone biosynthesis C-methylase UbiE